ncbi:MAG TPA: hypothetical protein VGE74_19690 [Gemmata sp.]
MFGTQEAKWMARAKRIPSVDDFHRIIRKLGRLLVALINEQAPTKRKKVGWESGFIDVRWVGDIPDNVHNLIAKIRFTRANGTKLGSVQIPHEISALYEAIGRLRLSIFTPIWYGLKVTVYPDAKPVVAFDENPECCVDPLWYQS